MYFKLPKTTEKKRKVHIFFVCSNGNIDAEPQKWLHRNYKAIRFMNINKQSSYKILLWRTSKHIKNNTLDQTGIVLGMQDLFFIWKSITLLVRSKETNYDIIKHAKINV